MLKLFLPIVFYVLVKIPVLFVDIRSKYKGRFFVLTDVRVGKCFTVQSCSYCITRIHVCNPLRSGEEPHHLHVRLRVGDDDYSVFGYSSGSPWLILDYMKNQNVGHKLE
jgi:hypothetical protein